MVVLSPGRHGDEADRQHYLKQAEAKLDEVTSTLTKILFLRAKAITLQDARTIDEAEKVYREALALCSSESDDKDGNLAMQACIIRSSLIHILCSSKRLDEAREVLVKCDEYAQANKDEADGEMFRMAMDAGIHLGFESNDEDFIIERIKQFEAITITSEIVKHAGGGLIEIANRLSHNKSHRPALYAAEAAIRLGRRADDKEKPSFLLGCLYTEAMVLFQAGEHERALAKAEALLDLCNSPEDSIIRQACQGLTAEIRRTVGDSQTAVDLARLALESASANPESTAFFKMSLAKALNDNGETEEALKQAKQAWTLIEGTDPPERVRVEFFSEIAHFASLLGDQNALDEVLHYLDRLPDSDEKLNERREFATKRASANTFLRDRFAEVSQMASSKDTNDAKQYDSLGEANAAVVEPLVRLWDEVGDAYSFSYDFWGRGNFAQLLINARQHPNSFNITLEVRTLADIKKAIRFWGIYADFLMLIWKGEMNNGMAIGPFPEDYESPGGWGYMIAAGSELTIEGSSKKWYPAMGQISMFPEEVAAFLASEALSFIQAGRLIVVPAVSVGCVNPGHGPFEQLLAEAANAVPNVRSKDLKSFPIGLVPHSPDAPIHLLAELADTESEKLRKLRLLLLQRTRGLLPHAQVSDDARLLSLEIDDALRDLKDRNERFSRMNGLERATEELNGGVAPFRSNGHRLLEDEPTSPFAPLFVLQSLGYGWRVDGNQYPVLPSRFEPESGDIVGTWLSPPTRGWTFPMVALPEA